VEAARAEGFAEGSVGKHEELGLDAVDAGSGLDELEEMVEEGVADGVVGGFGFAVGVDVADDGLAPSQTQKA
jgi:hypothetical protein